MLETKTILLENVPIPDKMGSINLLDIPIHIITIGRQIMAIIELPRDKIFYESWNGKLTHITGAVLGYQYPHGAATRNVNDTDYPDYGEKLAVRRACCNADLEYDELGPVGKLIYRAYRAQTKAAAKANLEKWIENNF